MIRKTLICISVLAICVLTTQAFEIDTTKRIRVLPVPTLGYSPETKAYAGFVALATIDWYRDTQTRVSNAKIELNYTLNRQFIAETGWNFLTEKEKWFSQGLLHVSKYPDLYYGIGYSGDGSEPLRFESTRIKAETQILKATRKKWFIGPSLRFAHFGNLKGDSISKFNELKPEYFLGAGINLLNDQRDNLLNARKGHYVMISASGQKCLHHFYSKLTIDGRIYFTLNNRVTLASRIFQQMNLSDPVYFDQAVAGGDGLVRGYFYGMYRNRHLGVLQSELRTVPYKRIGLAFFGGYSCLFNHNFQKQDVNLFNYGAGLRILVDKSQNINLRIDYGRGVNGQHGFYIAFGEVF